MLLHNYKERFNSCANVQYLNETLLLPSKKKTAFTLAEVLITLGIIGVVAAIIIPSLINKYQKHVLHNQFKQAYSILSQMHQRMLNDEILPYEQFFKGSLSHSKAGSSEHIDTMVKYLNATVCNNNYRNCTGGKAYLSLNSLYGAHIDPDVYLDRTILLNNGMTIWIGWGDTRYFFDINGTGKGPNKLGYDLFTIVVDSKNKLIPSKGNNGNIANVCSFTRDAAERYRGFGCTYYALMDEHPDEPGKTYWKDFLK